MHQVRECPQVGREGNGVEAGNGTDRFQEVVALAEDSQRPGAPGEARLWLARWMWESAICGEVVSGGSVKSFSSP